MVALTPEQEWLVRCVASPWSPDATAMRTRTCSDALPDWERLLALAEEHYVLPLVASTLSRFEDVEAPADVRSTMADAFRANARWSLRLAGEQVQIADATSRKGIRAIGWKGPTLAMAAYGHLGLRMFSDLDLLIEPAALDAATTSIVNLGFQVDDSQPDLRVRTFTGSDGLVVELHWGVMPWWWASDLCVRELRSEAVDLGGCSVPQLAPADLLVTLCAHGGKHRWHRLQWVADVAGLIHRRPDLDWARAAALARHSGTCRALQVGLSVTAHLLDVSLPFDAARIVDDDRAAAKYGATIAARFFRDTWPPRAAGRLRYATLQWRLKERWRDRLRYISGRTIGRLWHAADAVKRPSAPRPPALC